MNPAWRSVSWWLGILFGAIALVVILEAVDLSLRGKLFPLAIGIPVAVFAILHTVFDLKPTAAAAADEESPRRTADGVAGKRVFVVFLWVGGLLAGTILLGQEIAVPVFVFVYAVVHGERYVTGLAAAAAVWAFIHFVLAKGLSIVFFDPFLFRWLLP
jgi:hypothetical protein